MLMKVWAGHCLCLNIACADGTFVGLKGMEKHHSQWVEPQCDGLSVLVSNVEHCKPKTPLHFPYTRERTECKVGIQEI